MKTSRTKKSIEEAMIRAKQHSAQYPDRTVRVLDKLHKHAVVCASEWVYNERILDGWYTVVSYKAGREV